jgi:protein TonB
MTRILVSALAAVVIHGAALFFLPFSAFVPGTVSPEDHGIAIQITHLPPEPEKKTDPMPASDLPPGPRPEEQPPPVQKQPPEEKLSPEKKQPPEEQQPPEPVPDIETLPPVPPEIDVTPDPAAITANKELMPKKEDLTLSPPQPEAPFPEPDEPEPDTAETAQGASGGMTASIDKTQGVNSPTDRDPASEQIPRKQAVPIYKENPPPRYPGNARRRGHAGTVLLMVYVNEKGEADQVRVFESSGHASLDRAAAKSVAGWRFEPGTSGGIPTGMWVKIPITFELKK